MVANATYRLQRYKSYFEQPQKLFNYIHQAKKIEAWTPFGGEPSEMVKNYLRFWELMSLLFTDF